MVVTPTAFTETTVFAAFTTSPAQQQTEQEKNLPACTEVSAVVALTCFQHVFVFILKIKAF